jgi:anti-anti-sigma factor
MTDGFLINTPTPSRTGALAVNSVHYANAMQFVLSGELDLTNADALRDVLWRALENVRRTKGAPARLILDMRSLTFIDSTGIQTLVATKRHCEETGTQLTFKLGNSQVARVLSLAGVAEFLGREGG